MLICRTIEFQYVGIIRPSVKEEKRRREEGEKRKITEERRRREEEEKRKIYELEERRRMEKEEKRRVEAKERRRQEEEEYRKEKLKDDSANSNSGQHYVLCAQSINIIHGSIKNHHHKILKMLKYLKKEEENLLKT